MSWLTALIFVLLWIVILFLVVVVSFFYEDQIVLIHDLYESQVFSSVALEKELQVGDLVFEWYYEHLKEFHNLPWRWLSSFYLHGSVVVLHPYTNLKCILEYVPFKRESECDAEDLVFSSSYGCLLLRPLQKHIHQQWAKHHTQLKVYRPCTDPSSSSSSSFSFSFNRKKAIDICQQNLYTVFNCCSFLSAYVWNCQYPTWSHFLQQTPGKIQERLEQKKDLWKRLLIQVKNEHARADG
jgi:hypothetical protein